MRRPSPIRLQIPSTEYTLSDRSREARAPPEPKRFPAETGLLRPGSQNLSELPGSKKAFQGRTLEGFRM